jgi:hypothetical protein
MAQILDARGNEFQGAVDQVGTGSITDGRTAGATLNAVNSEVAMDIYGKAVAVFEIRAAANVATYVFEASVDGTNFYPVPVRPMPGSTIGGAAISEGLIVSQTLAAAAAAAYAVSATGYRRVRCRVSAFTSGSAVVTGRATIADYAIIAQPQPSIFNVSQAPAANTGGTITLPAVPGMFHYVTAFQCTLAMNPATAQTGAAPVFVTTTNLPATPAWAVPIAGNAAASTGGLGAAFVTIASEQWNNPLKSSAANTNTTFVLPAPGAACTIRGNVQYYLGA